MSSSPSDIVEIEPSGFFGSGKSRSAAELARSVAAIRPARPVTSRSRISAAKAPKKARVKPLGPTPERLAKGDVQAKAGFHRAVPPVERLRDQGKLDHDARTNQAMFEAAEKLKRHFIGAQLIGVKAQDLNRVHGNSELDGPEFVEQHRKIYAMAKTLMGFSEENAARGCARIVESVVCYERPVSDVAAEYTGESRMERAIAVAMDRLRQGLWSLAVHWRMV